MLMNLKFLPAEEENLTSIINLYREDELGLTREELNENAFKNYLKAYHLIKADKNQALMVVKNNENDIIATCHLTIMPTLVLQGSTRLNIEAVRVSEKFRGQNIGQWMFQEIVNFGKKHDVKIFQLTTNKKRDRAKRFYEKLGFHATHEGMKLYANH